MLNAYTIPTYKGFQLQISEDFKNLNYYCVAYKYPYYLDTIDEHGKLHRTLHEAEMVEFTVERSEIYMDEGTESDVIFRRFRSEVDCYLKQNAVTPKNPDTGKLIRKYRCEHCGTDATLENPGYTPTCPNCGALMRMEE